jgi:hypothetical protein
MPATFAMSDSRSEYLLAQSPAFQSRCAMTMCDVATTVLNETGVGDTHAKRAQYANLVLSNPNAMAAGAAMTIAQSANVKGTIAITDDGATSSVTDAALLSQISSLWNVLAGVDMGS